MFAKAVSTYNRELMPITRPPHQKLSYDKKVATELIEGDPRLFPRELPMIPFSKKDYKMALRQKRSEFVTHNFASDCIVIFDTLEKSAKEGKECHVEANFIVPEYFDICKTKDMLKQYFEDLGYDVIVERKVEYPSESDKAIILTLK